MPVLILFFSFQLRVVVVFFFPFWKYLDQAHSQKEISLVVEHLVDLGGKPGSPLSSP